MNPVEASRWKSYRGSPEPLLFGEGGAEEPPTRSIDEIPRGDRMTVVDDMFVMYTISYQGLGIGHATIFNDAAQSWRRVTYEATLCETLDTRKCESVRP